MEQASDTGRFPQDDGIPQSSNGTPLNIQLDQD
jgi:hypothetical protein